MELVPVYLGQLYTGALYKGHCLTHCIFHLNHRSLDCQPLTTAHCLTDHKAGRAHESGNCNLCPPTMDITHSIPIPCISHGI